MRNVGKSARRLAWAAAVLMTTAWRGHSADWPCYRHDPARSGVTTDALAAELHLRWSYQAAQPPRPAWPEPGRELHRLAFDYAFDPVSAGGLVVFGSSADHKVYALDLDTGEERWAFFCEGPVRFAPAIADGRVFVGSDGGRICCLDLRTGARLWQFRPGPRREYLFGNGQIMSRWPLRTGVAVADGRVHAVAGMWPSDGVHLVALRAADGEPVMHHTEGATRYQPQPHPGSFAMLGVSPQGYLVMSDSRIFVPTGRNVPAVFDRATGAFQYYRSAPDSWSNRWGGTWNILVRDKLLTWRNHHVPDLPTVITEAEPHPEDGLAVFDTATGRREQEVRGKLRAVADGAVLYASGGGTLGAYDLDAWFAGQGWRARWEVSQGRTYALIKAGDGVVVGGAVGVRVFAAQDGRLLWEQETDGQVRGLAVADSRLMVSTTGGRILCFGPRGDGPAPTREPGPDAALVNRLVGIDAARARAQAVLRQCGVAQGYCLALGAGDVPFLYHLLQAAELTVIIPEAEIAAADRMRDVLDAAGVYGTRAVVHNGDLRDLHYPPFFADLILAGSEAQPVDTGSMSGAALYRLLRPCGGVLRVHASTADVRETIRRWLAAGGVPEAEMAADADGVIVRRGALPGGDDWTHEYGSAARTGASGDRRVQLPLRMLWFGEPGPATIVSRHWQGPAPLCVNGRMIVTGQRHITTVNAYNGRVLWRREFPQAARWSIPGKGSNVAAVGDSIFLATGGVCQRLAAASGDTVQTYTLPAPADLPAKLRGALDVWSFLGVDGGQVFGSMGKSESEGHCLFALNAASGACEWTYVACGPVHSNAVSVGRDRVYLIEQIGSEDVALARERGIEVAAGRRLVALERGTGGVSWDTREGISKRTTLWLSEGILAAIGGGGLSGYQSASGVMLYSRTASFRRSPVIVDGTIYLQPRAFDLQTGDTVQRADPFTDSRSAWEFVRSYGCGSMGGCPNLLAFRSATLGFYGLRGDTGVHNFPGVRAGCCLNAIPANGLLLVSPGDAACSCSYSFQTTVALVPDPDQEDWGVFYDRLPNTAVDRVSLNVGAPGDRRADDGVLWLAAPRPPTRTHRRDIAVPFRFECLPGFGSYHEVGRPRIGDTEVPWVYANGMRGIRHAEIDLDIMDRGFAAWFTPTAPEVDGVLSEPCWDGYKAYPAQGDGSSVMLRYDRDALYLGYTGPCLPGAGEGDVRPDDGPVWEDGACEVIVSSVPPAYLPHAITFLHMGLSATGARYDAKWDYRSPYGILDIPRLEIVVDGSADDWADDGLCVGSLPGPGGKLQAPDDLDVDLRLGWCLEGLLVLAQIRDDTIRESTHGDRLYEGDCLEFFVTPRMGSAESYQVSVAPGVSETYPSPRLRFYDRRHDTREGALTGKAASAPGPNGYVLELLLPWRNVGLEPTPGAEVGVQVFVHDADDGPTKGPHALWHAAGHTEKNALAYQCFRLASEASPRLRFSRSVQADAKGLYSARKPHAFPLSVPPLGARAEQTDYTGPWRGAARRTGTTFSAELAIPWASFEAAGLDRTALMLNLRQRGAPTAAPRLGHGFEALLIVPMNRVEPKRLTVRLHFVEPDEADPGERVFDVMVQGATVLPAFDIVRASGGSARPVVREFTGILAAGAVHLDFVPRASPHTALTVPVINAIEIVREE